MLASECKQDRSNLETFSDAIDHALIRHRSVCVAKQPRDTFTCVVLCMSRKLSGDID